jgi:dolichyl-phosphate-mannose-protein mannosyltransferase
MLTCACSQLFLHHYFPALYFAIMAVAQIFDFATSRIVLPGNWTLKDKPFVGRTGAVVFLAASIVVFGLYAPLTYGNTWTKKECNRVKLFNTWDWDCNTFLDSYADYSLAVPSASGPAPTGSAPALHGPAPPKADDPKQDVVVTPGQPMQQQVLQGGVTEEKVEYRDENGNLLDEAQVKELEGKVSFSTRYETRTRLVDAAGNEIYNEVVEPGVAGTMADGPDPETEGQAEASAQPPKVNVDGDVEKEEAVGGMATAEPESEAAVETKDEL